MTEMSLLEALGVYVMHEKLIAPMSLNFMNGTSTVRKPA